MASDRAENIKNETLKIYEAMMAIIKDRTRKQA